MPRASDPRVVVRLTPAEDGDLRAAAERAGLPLATYVRRAAIGHARGLHELAPSGPLVRLDDAVAARLGMSPARAWAAVKAGRVLVNGVVVLVAAQLVAPDDVLVLVPPGSVAAA